MNSKKRILVNSLLTPPEMRTDKDTDLIYEETKHIEFFHKNLQDDGKIHKACCTLMALEEFSPGETVIKHGDQADKFYIVISGKLSVQVPISGEVESKKLHKPNEVKQLNDGDYFGELALIKNSPRAATVVASTSTLLAVLKKSDFKKTVMVMAERKINEKVVFLKKVPIFQGFSSAELQRLSYYFTELQVMKSQIIYRENSSASWVYFIKQGDFMLTKNELEEDPEKHIAKHSFIERVNLTNHRIKKRRNFNLQIVIKSENEYLGSEEMLENSECYKTTCTCISTYGVLYCISFIDFKQRIKLPECWKILNDKLDSDKVNFEDRIKNLKFVETVKDEFKKNHSASSLYISSSKSFLLKKFSPVRDILKSPYLINPESTKPYITGLKLKSLQNSQSSYVAWQNYQKKKLSELGKFEISRPLAL